MFVRSFNKNKLEIFVWLYIKGAPLAYGDHIPNVFQEADSKIRHLLVDEDATLKSSSAKFGYVKFVQVKQTHINLRNKKKF